MRITLESMPRRDTDTVFLIRPDPDTSAVFCDAVTGQVYENVSGKILPHALPTEPNLTILGPFTADKLIVFESLGKRNHPVREILDSYLYLKLTEGEKENVATAFQRHYGLPLSKHPLVADAEVAPIRTSRTDSNVHGDISPAIGAGLGSNE